jgi:hypothetical protein
MNDIVVIGAQIILALVIGYFLGWRVRGHGVKSTSGELASARLNMNKAQEAEEKTRKLMREVTAERDEYEAIIREHDDMVSGLNEEFEQKLLTNIKSAVKLQDRINELERAQPVDYEIPSLKEINSNKSLAIQWLRIKYYLREKCIVRSANMAITKYNADVDAFKADPKAVKRWRNDKTVPVKISPLRPR